MAKQPIRGGKNTGKVSFSAALKKTGVWDKSRTVEDTFGKNNPDNIEDGDYVGRMVTATCSVSAKGVPTVKFQFAVSRGDCKGSTLIVNHFLVKGKKRTLEEVMERFAIDLQRMGYDTSEMEEGDTEIICQQLTEAKDEFKLRVAGSFVNIVGVVEDDNGEDEGEGEGEAEGEDAGENSAEPGPEENQGEEAEGEGEAEDAEPTPEKDDLVMYKPKGLKSAIKCVITAVQASKETVTLKSSAKGTVYKAVPFSEFEFVTEE